ncbi:MAG: hypothetical protein ACT4NT_02955 [Nitrososphaerota archaeon]
MVGSFLLCRISIDFVIITNRRGVFDAGIIILGAIIVIIAIISATLAWSDILQVTYVELVTKIPKFDYVVQSATESGNKNFEVYAILRLISFLLIVFVLMFAGMSIMFEKINLMPPETGFAIISKSIYFVFFFFFFPPLWDISAVTVEQMSVWILNPEDPTKPTKNVEILLKKLGSIECADPSDPAGSCQFTFDKIIAGITDPFGTLKNIFQTAFLGIFKAIAFLAFMFTSFLVGTIRQVLTAIVIIGLPIILILSLIPFFKRITDRFVDALLGLLIAPIFSSLVIVAGVAYLGTLNSPDPIMEWFAALAIMALASLVPTMIVPMMGSIIGVVHGMATSAISTGAMVTGMAGAGATHGLVSTLQGINKQEGSIGASNADLRKTMMLGPNLTSIVSGATSGMSQNRDGAKTDHRTTSIGNAMSGLGSAGQRSSSNINGVGSIPDAILDSAGIEHKTFDVSRASLRSEISIDRNHLTGSNMSQIQDGVKDAKTFTPPATLFGSVEAKAAPNLIDEALRNTFDSKISTLDGGNKEKIESDVNRDENKPSNTHRSFFDIFKKITRSEDRS